MTREEIISMAREAGMADACWESELSLLLLTRFASLVAAAQKQKAAAGTFVYHYCTKKQINDHQEAYIDGIVTLAKPVEGMTDYMALKEKIAENQDIGGGKGLIIISLTELPSSMPNGEAECP